MLPRASLLVALASFTLMPSTEASVVPAGSKLRGTIESPTDTDEWVMPFLEGSTVTIQVVGSPGLVPLLEIQRLPGDVDVDVAEYVTVFGGNKFVVKNWVVEATAHYRLRISDAQGNTGSFKVTTKHKAAKSKLKPSSQGFSVEANESVVATFDAIPGSTITLTATASKSAGKAPTISQFVSGNAPMVFLHKVKSSKLTTRIKGLSVPRTGVHLALILNSGDPGTIKTSVRIKLPKPAKGFVDEYQAPEVTEAVKAAIASGSDPDPAFLDIATRCVKAMHATDDPRGEYLRVRRGILDSLKKPSTVDAYRAACENSASILTLPNPYAVDPIAPSTGLSAGQEPLCDPEITVFFINGVLTDKASCIATAALIQAQLLAVLPDDLRKRVRVKHFYNPSGISSSTIDWICGSFAEIAGLAIDAQALLAGWSPLYAEAMKQELEKLCQIGATIGTGIGVDLLVESPLQWVTQVLTLPPLLSVAAEFGAAIDQQVQSGNKVIVFAHSQGNFYTQEALSFLSSERRKSVGVIALASPASYPDQGSYGAFAHFNLLWDIINVVPFSPSSNVINPLSLGTTCELGPLFALACALQRVSIHDVANSYLGYAQSAAPIHVTAQAQMGLVQTPTTDLGSGFLQATLEWNINGDIDLHVFEPGGSHVYYADKQGAVGQLDYDDIVGNGPENYYVCTQAELVPGTYAVSVNNFNGKPGTSGTVRITAGDDLMTFGFTVGEATQGAVLIPVASVTYHANGTFSFQ